MRDIVLEVRAEAEAELIMAKAKLAVAESILAKYDERVADEAQEVVTEEIDEVEEVATEEDFTTV